MMKINDQGIKEIANFLTANHKRGSTFTREMLQAWASDAEFQLREGNMPCIEIRAQDCIHGRTMEYCISSEGIAK